jgi:hypothetical protein
MADFRVLRQTEEWKNHVRGGVYAVEVVFSPTTELWHVHLHIIADGLYWSQRDLSKAWEVVTVSSYIVDIRLVGSRRAAANYIARYVAKPLDAAAWPDSKLREFADALHGKRMVHTFGKSYAVEVEPEEPGVVSEKAERLCSANSLMKAARLHDAYAKMGLELLGRTRGALRAAIRVPGEVSSVPWLPLEEWETERLLYCLRIIGQRSPTDKPAHTTHWDTGHLQPPLRQGSFSDWLVCTS